MTCATPIAAQSTELQVNISPQEAVNDGAVWRYKDKNYPAATWSNWWDSGQSMELYGSTFLVQFRATNSTDWITPPVRTVIVASGQHKVINQTYQSSNTDASLTVTLNTNSYQANVSNATWSLYSLFHPSIPSSKVYVAKDLNSGETITFEIKSNFYYVEYSYVKDLARPYDEAIPVTPGCNLVITGKYKDLIVGNVHIFGNKLEYDDNTFRTSGNTQWAFKYNSGTESVKYIKCKADLTGSYNPAVIKGKGTLHTVWEFGKLDEFFTAFNDNVFYDGKFLLDADTLKTIETSLQKPVWDYIGFSATTMEFEMIKSPIFGLSQTSIGEIDLPIFTEPTILRYEELKIYKDDDSPQITGDVIWEGAEVPGLFTISETQVYIDTSTKTFTADGFDVVINTALPSFRGDIEVVDGVVKKLSAELYGIGQKIADWPIIFDNCGFSFAHPNRESVKVGITAGVKFVIPGTSIDAGSESWAGNLDINGHLKVSGKKEIFGYEIGDAETEVQWKGNTQYVSSFIDASYYVSGYVQFQIQGQGYMYLQWKPSFSFNGWILASGWVPLPDWLQPILPGWLLEQVEDDKINLASFMVDINALGMNVSFSILKLYNVVIPIPAFWNNSSSSIATVSASQQELSKAFTSKTLTTGSVENFTVNQGEAGFILSLQGNTGAPDAVLVMPNGTRIDPRNFVSTDDIHVAFNDTHSVTGFIIKDPQPGLWIVELINSAGVTQRLIRGNHPPRILSVELENKTDGSYELTYEAFDADNNAVITFYLSPNNTSFQGQKTGTAIENDGSGTFTWNPDNSITTSGYICAVIDDGISQTSQVYFEGRIVGPNAPSPPLFSRTHMSGDTLILTFDDSDFSGIDSLNVYYSDDLETDNLTEYFTVFPGSQVELSDIEMAPGRVYQLRVTAFSEINGESRFSGRFDVDYRLTTGNNYPNIISKPSQRTRISLKTDSYDIDGDQYTKIYTYQLKVEDYDNDPIYYSIIRGPEQLNISSTGLIHGEFSNKEVGSKSVVVQVDDGNGGTDIQKFRINLTPPSQYNAMSISRSSANDYLIINLKDVTSNYNSHMIDTITATLQDSVFGIQWTVTLRETSVNSGEFQGLVQPNNSELNIIKSRNGNFLLRWDNRNSEAQIYKSSLF